jgi:hypothetical protein
MEKAQRRFDFWIRVLLGAMIVVVAILCLLLVHQYRVLRSQESMLQLQDLHAAAHAPMTDPSSIQPWMTYDYISHVYALPTEYLRSDLHIADTRYPRVSIAESAEVQGVSADALTSAVKVAVGDYIASHGGPNGS